MNNQNRMWILGASDPEMRTIETLLIECGERVVYDAAGEHDTLNMVIYRDQSRSVSISLRGPNFPDSLVGQVIAELARLGALPASWHRIGYFTHVVTDNDYGHSPLASIAQDPELGWIIQLANEKPHGSPVVGVIPQDLVLCAARSMLDDPL